MLTPASFIPKTITPTDEQKAIQVASEKTVLVEANAGAAKTTTLALRMAESLARGINPADLLALTCTVPACQALRDALKKIGVALPIANRLRIDTFEHFSKTLLDAWLGATVPVLHAAEDLKAHVWNAVQKVEANESERWRADLLLPSLGDNGFVEDFLRANTLLKGSMQDDLLRDDQPVTPDYATALGVDYTLLKVYLAFEALRRQGFAEKPLFRGPVDATFDLARLLMDGAADGTTLGSLPSWPTSLRVLVVDEMHDLNEASFRVLQELLNTTPAFFCGVGDRDQVIHSATGADAKFMAGEINQRTRRTVLRYALTHSYRFGKELAAKVGRLSGKRYSSMAAHGTSVSLAAYDDHAACTQLVVQGALAWRARPKAKMAEFAVLLRHPFQSVEIENALLAQGLPYTTSGFDSYLMRPEVLLVRGLLAVATDSLQSVADPTTREKVVQALVFFCGAHITVQGREHESQAALLKDAIRSVTDNPRFLSHFFDNQVLKTVAPATRRRLEQAVQVAKTERGAGLLTRVLDALQVQAMVNEVLVSRQRRLDAMGNLAGIGEAAKGFDTAGAYFQHLNDAEQRQRELKKPASLVLASLESVKGLEFEHVVVPYLEQGQFPAAGAPASEEQNRMYVAATRAKLFLTLYAHRSTPSRFVAQMGWAPQLP